MQFSTQPTNMSWERRYSDDSGVEYAVRLIGNKVEFESKSSKMDFPIDELYWVLGCLEDLTGVIE